MKLAFLGGVGTVTGSKYLVETGNRRILVDCGLFQDFKQLRLRNWEPLPVHPGSIDGVMLPSRSVTQPPRRGFEFLCGSAAFHLGRPTISRQCV